jgi:hypothetical protein
MFIVSKRNFIIPRGNGEKFSIPNQFMGEVPNDVASHWLIKAAMKDGLIVAPPSKKDKDLIKAAEKAQVAEDAADIRPDAKGKQKAKSEK